MPLKIRNGETILFIGDSITDCGRRADAVPLGEGYVKLFADMLAVREPAKKVTIINRGISGNRISDLRERWTDDVMRHEPDWLAVQIGFNDVHGAQRDPATGLGPGPFAEVYDGLLARTRDALPGCRFLLIDPFYICAQDSPDPARRQVLDLLAGYIGAVHDVSRKYETRLVSTHERFKRLLESHDAATFCPEPVHPHFTGHLAIAEWVYEALSK